MREKANSLEIENIKNEATLNIIEDKLKTFMDNCQEASEWIKNLSKKDRGDQNIDVSNELEKTIKLNNFCKKKKN